MPTGGKDTDDGSVGDKSEHHPQVAEHEHIGFESYYLTGLQSLVLESFKIPKSTIDRLKLHEPEPLNDEFSNSFPGDTKKSVALTQDTSGGNSLLFEEMSSSPKKTFTEC